LNTLSKITSIINYITIIQICFLFGCWEDKKKSNPQAWILTGLGVFQQQENFRTLDEPNNTFETSTCLGAEIDQIRSYIYPKEDIDIFNLSIATNNFKLFISNVTTFGSNLNFGFQVYDEQGILIYDVNQRSFDGLSKTIIANRNILQEECLIEKCHTLTNIRYIEFSSFIKKIYIKIYSLNPHYYNESSQLKDEFTMISKNNTPMNIKFPPNLILTGDLRYCEQ